jgi:hypothetical protein
MQPGSTGAYQDPEQGAPDPSPENKAEVATPDLDAVAALEDRLRRALADLDNLRKRHARELDRERVYAHNWIDYKDGRYCEGCDLATLARSPAFSAKP